ncbi:ribosome recycling factor [Candidatus Gottesmanbacteria bacterium RBG_16_43_7]|uniref:Ribosome recycling factor n=1 Tax=Candidatus Gottesmanbacteria bacterium RBG_16_43_7 TaxID=1798373 RepID=A0A1F5ZCR7_9BACT|nr:MAG: ribosome recycling factor [Candidatus Gottesmanbacteria bacterium RBG_16_43_7]
MIAQLLVKTRQRMQKAYEVTQTDIASVRSGRASPSLVENIIISAYENTTKMKVMEMATVTTQDARTLIIAAYDPSQIPALDKGIKEANIGLTPLIDGDIIRISIPPLSEERRLEYLKLAKTKIESGKIMIRQARGESIKEMRHALEERLINEDEKTLGEKQIQEVTDQFSQKLDELSKQKEAELMQI